MALLLFAAGGTADAHAILIGGQPQEGQALPPGPTVLTLHYNSRIDHRRSRLTLTLPDRSQTILSLDPNDPADVLSAAAALTPGAYTLHWQVLAVDGHITRGDVGFRVAAP